MTLLPILVAVCHSGGLRGRKGQSGRVQVGNVLGAQIGKLGAETRSKGKTISSIVNTSQVDKSTLSLSEAHEGLFCCLLEDLRQLHRAYCKNVNTMNLTATVRK